MSTEVLMFACSRTAMPRHAPCTLRRHIHSDIPRLKLLSSFVFEVQTSQPISLTLVITFSEIMIRCLHICFVYSSMIDVVVVETVFIVDLLRRRIWRFHRTIFAI